MIEHHGIIQNTDPEDGRQVLEAVTDPTLSVV
jgi:hypothetical protein